MAKDRQGAQKLPIRTAAQNGGGASGRSDRPRAEGELNVGDKIVCVARHDNNEHIGEILERKTCGEGKLHFYIHYDQLDKRLDHWASAQSVRLCLPSDIAKKEIGSPRLTSAASGELGIDGPQKLTRRQKRKYEEVHHIQQSVDDLPPTDQEFEKEHQEKTKIKNIQLIQLGKYTVSTWYYSPYPHPYRDAEKLYLCEYSLKYFRKKKTLYRHLLKLEQRSPPGDEIYRSPPPVAGVSPPSGKSAVTDPRLSVFEVDGRSAKVYCQNLCLLSKLFLDHKTLYYDVDPFLFYVVCECDAEGHHIVGYFSKEKHSLEDFNLACILCLPPYQKRGYGKFMIQMSYELSRREGKKGTPERPLSDLGQVSYRSYWTRVLIEALYQHRGNISLQELSDLTAIRTEDIVWTLQPLELIKYRRGEHVLVACSRILEMHLDVMHKQRFITVDPECIRWTPPAARTS